MKRVLVGAANRVLAMAGCELIRTSGDLAPDNSLMIDEDLQRSLEDELAAVAQSFFVENLPDYSGSTETLAGNVKDFFELYRRKPRGRNIGGSGFHNLFWLYLVSRAVEPELFIESGVWKGHATWFIEQAIPDADIHGFDLDLGYVESSAYRNVHFHEYDWTEHSFERASTRRSVVFFDCHQNHARRILEASGVGLNLLLFDDDLPLNRLYVDGSPGVPTAHMLRHLEEPPENPIGCVHRGRRHSFRIDGDEFEKARQLIRHHVHFPDVGGLTGFGGYTFLSLVLL